MAAPTSQRIQHLEMTGIVKRFPGVLANDQIDFDVRAGEIHALLGENGAGKSTLMKILYGLYQPDEGEIRINSEPVSIQSPSGAIGHNIGMIHQHFMLVPPLTVAENVISGLPSSRHVFTDTDRAGRRIRELAESYGLKIDPEASVWQLAVGEQQRVEIIKALYRGADLLILDEPTAVLTPQEVDELFVTLKRMRASGHALIFISHKLHEAVEISDRITVLRDGRVVGQVKTEDTDQTELARMMVGRDVIRTWEKPTVQRGKPMLRIQQLQADSDRGYRALKGVSLDVHEGEIVGIAGVSGNGQRELAETITGLRPVLGGKVILDGKDITHATTEEVLAAGLSFIPEERLTMGVIKEFNVAENMILATHHRPPYSNGFFLNFKQIADHADQLIRNYEVKTPGRETPVKNLSGGNIQKLILARELSRTPKVLVAAQPTHGVDIGSTEYIHKRLIEQRSEGTATLLISEDLEEILALSDRIAVIYEGQIIGVVECERAKKEELGLWMAGINEEREAQAAV
jgi:simple sugar transport system ATP-binding protein